MLIYMQKIEFFTHFFLQRKVTHLLFWVIWVCLSTHTKHDSINSKKHLMFICRQKSTLSFMFSLRYCNGIANLLFWALQACLSTQAQVMLSACKKLLCLCAGKKSTSSPTFFWKYCEDMHTSYFGCFGHARLCTPKMIVSTSFLRYILKNPTI